MRFLRSLRVGDDGRAPDEAPAGGAGARTTGSATGPEDDEARSARLTEEFEGGLSELSRRQLRFARYAWEPPAQLDRRGRWILRRAMDGVDEDGRRVALRGGEGLELDETGEDGAGDHEPGRESWRFTRRSDGRTVHLEAGPDGDWPDGLERPRDGGEGS